MKLNNRIIFILILLVSCIFRFYNFSEIPFTHDEFSALFRTEYGSFGDLINLGIYPDGHPAGVQVFLYYWVKLVGMTEWLIKLPFTLAGVAAIFFIFKISKVWYNETVGLVSAAFMGSMQIMVMYSQIARPYISGLLFVLSMVYFWSLLIRKPNNNFTRNSILYILSAILCSYNHHFSLLFVAILGVVGLFYIKREVVGYYITFGIVIFICYLPHLPILLAQIEIGGIEGWLAKPTASFFGDYVRYLFNFSVPEYLLIFGIILLGLIQARPNSFTFRKFVLFLSLFALPLTIGYLYSLYFSAVLQFSVLIFSTPFLFFVLFGHLSSQRVRVNAILVFIILLIGAYSLTYERKFYSLFYKSPYEVILSDLEKVRAEFPDANALIDSHQKISHYYIQKNSFKSDFQWITDSLSTKQILHYLESASQSSDYIYLGALPEIQPNIVALILDYFPSLIWQKNYAGATTYFFSKKQEEIERPLIQTQFGSDYLSNWSNVILENLLIDSASQQINSYMVGPEIEWAVSYTDTLKNWVVDTNDFIDISLCGVFNQQPKDALVVASLTNSDGELIYWGSSNFLEFAKVDSFPQKITLHHTIKFSDIKGINSSLIFKTFVWNKGFNGFSIQDFIISKRKGNPVIYGLVEKIE